MRKPRTLLQRSQWTAGAPHTSHKGTNAVFSYVCGTTAEHKQDTLEVHFMLRTLGILHVYAAHIELVLKEYSATRNVCQIGTQAHRLGLN
jgi:hypothetical protein